MKMLYLNYISTMVEFIFRTVMFIFKAVVPRSSDNSYVHLRMEKCMVRNSLDIVSFPIFQGKIVY